VDIEDAASAVAAWQCDRDYVVKHIKKWVATAELAIDSPLIRQQEKRECVFVN